MRGVKHNLQAGTYVMPVFFIIVASIIVLVVFFKWPESDSTEESTKLTVVTQDDGRIVVQHEDFDVLVPEGFEQPSAASLDFYDESRDCKVSYDYIGKVDSSIEDWISNRENNSGVTIIESELNYLENQHKDFDYYIYDVTISETGKNRILYIFDKLDNKLMQVVSFSENETEQCYSELENIIFT